MDDERYRIQFGSCMAILWDYLIREKTFDLSNFNLILYMKPPGRILYLREGLHNEKDRDDRWFWARVHT